MKKFLFVLIITMLIISCSDSNETELDDILTGSFTEVTPINGRVRLEFLSETQLKQEIADSGSIATFTIRLIDNNNLELNCNECDESAPQIVSYTIIDNNTFKIGGFFPAENSEVMFFERE